MQSPLRVAAAWLTLVGAAAPASAQMLVRPERVRDRLAPGALSDRVEQSLTSTFSAMGGYLDGLTSTLNTPSPTGATPPTHSGYAGVGDGNLHYRAQNRRHSIDLIGRAYMHAYRNIGLGPNKGGDLSASGRTQTSRNGTFSGQAGISFEPFLGVDSLSIFRSAGGLPVSQVNPLNGVANVRSRSTTASASYRHQFTTNTAGDVLYNLIDRSSPANGFDSIRHAGLFRIDRTLGRRWGLAGSYHVSSGTFDRVDGVHRNVADQSADGGFHYTRNLSRTRTFTISGGVGAAKIKTFNGSSLAPTEFWTPSTYATTSVDFGRTWSLTANFNRAVSFIQGTVADLFVTNGGGLHLGGLITDHVEAVFAATFAQGRVGTGKTTTDSGSAQLVFLVSQDWSLVTSYTRFDYRLDRVAAQNVGLVADVHRNAVNVGVVWSMPWAATRRTQRRGQGGR